jgi:hypothetical protein
MRAHKPDWSIFFDRDPYEGFDPTVLPDLQGWGSTHPIFEEVIKTIRPKIICEVGTWKGASAIHMATVCATHSIDAKIICIDTWLGTLECYAWKDTRPELHRDLRMINGWPHLYYTFIANVIAAGFADTIIPLPQTSSIAARLLRELNISPDIIYIDASHDYSDVREDLYAYYELVRPGGIVFGDDFIDWPGVTRAVLEFVAEKKLALLGCAGKFAVAKDANIVEIFRQAGRLGAGSEVAGLAPIHPPRRAGATFMRAFIGRARRRRSASR